MSYLSRFCRFRRLLYVTSAVVLVTPWCAEGGTPAPMTASEQLPWREDWQRVVAGWMAGLTTNDVDITPQPIDPAKVDPANARRNYAAISGGYAPLSLAADAVVLPTEAFLWEGGIWRPDLDSTQWNLTHWDLEKGQIWTPSHPTTACLLAWIYGLDRPWNPYFRNPAVARRAAVIALVNLLMHREAIFWLHDPQSPRPARGRQIHTGRYGFTLTFNAFTLWQVKDALPPDLRDAWTKGLLDFCHRLAEDRATGPENMQLSIPVALYYAYLATGDPWALKAAKAKTEELVIGKFRKAGYFPDGGMPDGSYNGIALHRVAELYSLTHWDEVLEPLRKSYRLKGYLSLIEPDGSWLSPSHFNARCKSSYANDQYQGREVQIALEVPEATPFLRRVWPEKVDPDAVVKQMVRWTTWPRGKAEKPTLWGEGIRVDRWDSVLQLPYVMYRQDDEKLSQLVSSGPRLPLESGKPFVVNLGDEFFCVRTPTYYAIVYAGPVSPFDNGATNQKKMLDGKGGYFNGFAGGGISAFWTPDGGSYLLGRFTAVEAYERQSITFPWHTYILGGWKDWANNHVVGKLDNGKILTSARTSSPRVDFDPGASSLEIEGGMVNKLPMQGVITEATVTYNRRYRFEPDALQCDLQVTSDRPLSFEALFEALPAHMTHDTKIERIDQDGALSDLTTGRHPGVSALQLSRYEHSIRIVFPAPVTINLDSVTLESKQQSYALVRAILIELPTRLEADVPISLSYEIRPNQ